MVKLFVLVIFFFSAPKLISAQKPHNKVYQKLISADSVILVSHITTYAPILEDSTYQNIGDYKLVEKNIVNYKIIKEHYHLHRKEVDSLAIIITEINTERTKQEIGCFEPHHGILIFKNRKCSFFDICFGCRHFVTSKDIALSDQLSDKTWLHLYRFFKIRKLEYELTGETIEQE